jgi:hypothetical protein
VAKRLLWLVKLELMERMFAGAYGVDGPVSIDSVMFDEMAETLGFDVEVDDDEFDKISLDATDSFVDYAVGGMVQ